MTVKSRAAVLFVWAWACFGQAGWQGNYPAPLPIPRLEKPPVIDGDVAEWKYYAFSDGLWDIFRVRASPWYDPRVNRLTDHGNEPPPEDDLNARYYMAWDDKYLYLGAEVHDNVNDVDDPAHSPDRWYYKDAICWFIEAPRHGGSKRFGLGDNAFCFVIDARKPPYGAWWRHGTPDKTFVEEPIRRAPSTLPSVWIPGSRGKEISSWRRASRWHRPYARAIPVGSHRSPAMSMV
jgi:hypothetical protein